MKSNRLTIAGLMTFVLFAAVGFAALRQPTLLWASAVFTATVLLLSTAVVGALARQGRGRLIWSGAAIFGWAYLLIAFGLGSTSNGATPPFLTKALSDSDYQRNKTNLSGVDNSPPLGEDITEPKGGNDLVQVKVIQTAEGPIGVADSSRQPPRSVPGFDWLDQRRIVHSLAALLFAAIGAGVGRLFAAKEERGEAR